MNRGYIRFVVELRDETELHVFEYIDSGMHKIDYSYHWQDKNKRLINGEEIKPSTEPNVVEILRIIG